MESSEAQNLKLSSDLEEIETGQLGHTNAPGAKEEVMKAVFIEEFKKPYTVKEIPIPKPGKGEVLIKVEAAPINPSDIEIWKGASEAKTLPIQAGVEGAGTVISCGGGLFARALVNRRVAFANEPGKSGTWAEYAITKADFCCPIGKDISFDEGACGIVNPFTAIGFLEEIKKENYKAVIQNAAASQLGRMLVKVLKKEGIKTINIVRREEQKKLLEDFGADIVINSQNEDFEEQLQKKAAELQATCLLEPVCGELTFKILRALPAESICYVYGHLAEETLTKLDLTDLLTHRKTLRSFLLPTWLEQQGLIKKLSVFKKVRSLLGSDLKSDIAKSFKIEDVNEALKFYTEHMTEGKVLIKSK